MPTSNKTAMNFIENVSWCIMYNFRAIFLHRFPLYQWLQDLPHLSYVHPNIIPGGLHSERLVAGGYFVVLIWGGGANIRRGFNTEECIFGILQYTCILKSFWWKGFRKKKKRRKKIWKGQARCWPYRIFENRGQKQKKKTLKMTTVPLLKFIFALFHVDTISLCTISKVSLLLWKITAFGIHKGLPQVHPSKHDSDEK